VILDVAVQELNPPEPPPPPDLRPAHFDKGRELMAKKKFKDASTS